MPQKDSIHDLVVQALRTDGWEITDDPYVISYGERFLFIDLAATMAETGGPPGGQFVGAERQGQRIVVEAKPFRGKSVVADLEQAIGQYVLYGLLLAEVDHERELFLAVTDITFDEIFNEPIGDLVVKQLPLRLIIINTQELNVKQWIPKPPIETL